MDQEYRLVAPHKTECSKGHPLTTDNEGLVKHHTPYGNYISRTCRQCAKEYRELRKRHLNTQRAARQPRPSKEELAELVGSQSWVALGLRYGVSDVAVRKWAKAYELI